MIKKVKLYMNVFYTVIYCYRCIQIKIFNTFLPLLDWSNQE